MGVYDRIMAWKAGDPISNHQKAIEWALYNESGGAFDRRIPGVKEGLFTPGDQFLPSNKRSLLSKAVGLSFEEGDSGGFTKFGFAQNAHMRLDKSTGKMVKTIDVEKMTLDDAERKYKELYWDPCRCDEMPYSVAFQVFDAACGSGPGRAIELLQEALGIAQDGKCGPVTIECANSVDERSFADVMVEKRLKWARYIVAKKPAIAWALPGWTRRWQTIKYGEKV
jgi:lysozyme family protein